MSYNAQSNGLPTYRSHKKIKAHPGAMTPLHRLSLVCSECGSRDITKTVILTMQQGKDFLEGELDLEGIAAAGKRDVMERFSYERLVHDISDLYGTLVGSW